MLGYLTDILTGTRRRRHPSVILVLQRLTSTSLLHIVPETDDVEHVEFAPPAFTYRGTLERFREQIATVSIYAAGNNIDEYLVEVGHRATKILSDRRTPGLEGNRFLSIEQALRSAVSASLESRLNDPPKIGDQLFPVFLVHIDRPKPEKILSNEFTSLGGTTILDFGRQFYIYAPSTILKLGTDEGEAAMTALAHNILGKVVPNVSGLVHIADLQDQGLLLDHQPGIPLVELWSTLSPTEQATVTKSLVDLLVRMRAPREGLDYYGRPNGQPYITLSELGPNDTHSYCHTYQEWSASRVHALHKSMEESEIDEARVQELEHIQQETTAEKKTLIDLPVLTHGDLSDRNILVDPSTLQVTGLIDWELANVAPAYFEYAAARLCGGHDPPWRKVLLKVLRQVLRIECDRALHESDPERDFTASEKENLFTNAMAAWNSLVDVERSAQGFSDACYWTFEEKA
ncbi:unnamed protein product [Aureobasidium mustum]|uniref:Aminoglycoside phosphotransferase domain-containing protein n=1 Tax=Aureobasidium mustum TaxID=2773714 RepID=A0A9N8JUB4_9PEZI|nr:unnamed protein product [Aureobasidium mustum]